MQTIYSVSITPYSVDTSQQQNLGFIDNVTCAQYLAQASEPVGFTLSQSMAKTQANLRWKYILQAFALMANPYVLDVSANGAAINANATTFTFNVYFERDSAVYIYDVNNSLLTGAAAVQYAIANVMATTYTDNAEYFNPTLTTSIQDDQATQPYDYNDQNVGTVVTGALAASASVALSNITVNVLSGASW
jgi:hypothetical protein